jgi:Cu+-exporting ATPase
MEVKQINLQVGGMTCAACSARVERGLKKIDGVGEASVNLATEKALVTYDPARVGKAKFIEAIQNMGYTV